MGADRRGRGGVGKAHLAAFGGIACLVLLAVFQALRDTHPDAVADRHDGATDFLSRKAHETGYARHTKLAAAEHVSITPSFADSTGRFVDVRLQRGAS